MSEPAQKPLLQITVRLADGRCFGPAALEVVARWARDGRVPSDAMIESTDGGPPIRADQHALLRALLGAPPTVLGAVAPADAGLVGTVIPYRNVHALAAYYVGVFSLIPCVSIVLGPVAVVLGVLGARYAAANPLAKGRVHAWVGIVLGSLAFIANIAGIIIVRNML